MADRVSSSDEAVRAAACQGFTIRERPDHQPLGPCLHCGKTYQQHRATDPVNSSDEAVEALARMLSTHERSWQWDHVSHEGDRQFWRGEAREAMDELRPPIIAAVRAEAVADERRRNLEVNAASESLMRYAADVYRHLRMDTPEDQETHAKVIAMLDRGADAFATRAAGSVPVATPPAEPAAPRLWPCEHGERGWHRTDDNRHCLGGAAPSQPVTCEHGKTRQHYEFLTEETP